MIANNHGVYRYITEAQNDEIRFFLKAGAALALVMFAMIFLELKKNGNCAAGAHRVRNGRMARCSTGVFKREAKDVLLRRRWLQEAGYRLPIWIKVLMLLTFILGFVVIWLKSGR